MGSWAETAVVGVAVLLFAFLCNRLIRWYSGRYDAGLLFLLVRRVKRRFANRNANPS